MPEQRKRLHCVVEIALSTTFLLASEVPAIAAFARSGLLKKRNFKKRERGTAFAGKPKKAGGRHNLCSNAAFQPGQLPSAAELLMMTVSFDRLHSATARF